MKFRQLWMLIFLILVTQGMSVRGAYGQPASAVPGYILSESQDGIIEGPLENGGSRITDFHHRIHLPMDESTYRITGMRIIDLFYVTKHTDHTTPLIHRVLCSGETCPRVQIGFVHPDPSGEDESQEYYQCKLEDARIVSINTHSMIYDGINISNETLAISAQKITWVHTDPNREYTEEAIYKPNLYLNGILVSRATMSVWDNSGTQWEGENADKSTNIYDYTHCVHIPFNIDENRPAGSRLIAPVYAVKAADRLSTIQKDVLCNQRSLTRIDFTFYLFDEVTLKEEAYFQVTVEEAKIVMDSTFMATEEIDGTLHYHLLEKLGFVGAKFTWKDLLNGIEYQEENLGVNVFASRNETANLSVQNFPNPFNRATTIQFTLPAQWQAQPVQLMIYDMRGALIREFWYDMLDHPSATVSWDATDHKGRCVPSGTYYFQIVAGAQIRTGKMMYIK